MKLLELFAGTRSIGKAFEARGHEVFSVEWNKDFENIDLCKDILEITADEIIQKFGKPDVIWASPDCSTFSVAAISHHRRKNTETGNLDPISEYAKFCDEVDQHVLRLIKKLNPKFFFIENPRGGMRKMTWMQGIPRYTVTYCQYGETRMKPTDIWTNHPNPQFKPPCKNGDSCHEKAPRGSQKGTQAMKTAKEKGVIPAALCRHIVDICENCIEECRTCTNCGKRMYSGYVINDGEEYFCDDDCLHAWYSEEEYDELCQQDLAYWTEWEEGCEGLNFLSLFSGIGAFEKGMDRLEVPYELIGFSEIDKYAVKSYCAIHGVDESMNLGDITKIDEKSLPKNIDFVTYGFPCQDISTAGKQKGLFNEDGTQTRSGLFFEALRIIEATKPKVAIAENVKNLTSKKFSEQFRIVLDSLAAAGYNNYWQVLNAKDYGVPQNRERVFIVSIRKDIDTGCFRFPEGFPLELRLKDILEETVDSKFYLETPFNQYDDGTCRTIKNQYYKNSYANFIRTGDMGATGVQIEKTEKVITVGNVNPSGKGQNGNVIDVATILYTRKHPPRGSDTSACLQANYSKGFSNHNPYSAVLEGSRIRKLTPKECFRLMDFDDADFEKAEAVNSNTQLYKQAGNSIVVAVAYYIEKALFDAGIFGGEAKEIELPEGQLSFSDIASFERYIAACKEKGSGS